MNARSDIRNADIRAALRLAADVAEQRSVARIRTTD